MTKLGEHNLEQAARKATGNWQDFECFVWFRAKELADADQWAVIYTHHRDSGLLDESNAAIIRRELELFAEGNNPDVVFESHTHWAVGHIDGFSIRVYRNGKITKAFEKYHELGRRMDDYPILDETDYSNREYEATLENIEDSAWKLKNDFDLPEGWVAEVYDWLANNQWTAIENTDDQGGYPDEEVLLETFQTLGFQQTT